jgi:uridine kinase
MPVIALSDVIADIRSRAAVGTARLVGIDGPAGSGKTTLARRLAALVDAPVVTTDDFTSWYDFAGWWPRFEEQVVAPLLAGRDAHYQVRDWVGDEHGESLNGWKTTACAPIVVLEGVTCTRDAIADRLTYRIWVEAPVQVRRERSIARDGERYRDVFEQWWAQEDAFFSADGTRDRADLFVHSAATEPHDPDTQVVSR